jgi:CRISPR system Cascade subunit CasB
MNDNAANVRRTVHSAIKVLTERGEGKRQGKFSSRSTAMLAKLRHAVGTAPAENVDIWEVTLGTLPDDLTGCDRDRSELAVHTALTLYGLHQQGTQESVSKNGISFGRAVKGLINEEHSNEAGVRRRFNALATALEFTELSYHLRGLVQLMRTNSIGFDYPRFASDLYWYQVSLESRNRVRMGWGRDFYARTIKNQDEHNAQGKTTEIMEEEHENG